MVNVPKNIAYNEHSEKNGNFKFSLTKRNRQFGHLAKTELGLYITLNQNAFDFN